MADDKTLTRRELEILALLAEGMSNDEIAANLSISPNTVKVHLRNIFEKMGVQSRTEATMEAVRKGWIVVPGMAPDVVAGDTGLAGSGESPAWPPLEVQGERWQAAVLAAVLILAMLFAFWPLWRPAPPPSGMARFTSEGWLERSVPATRRETPRWSSGAAMPTPRSRAAAAVIDGRLYVVGGESPAGDLADLEMYDPYYNTWQTLPARPLAARGSGATELDGTMLVVGGCQDSGVTSDVHSFDPASQTWKELTAYPFPACGVVLVNTGTHIYGIGGWDGAQARAEVFRYDRAADAWTEVARLPEGRAFGSAVWLRGLVYYLGGHDGETQRAEMWTYEPEADVWEPAPGLIEPRAGLVAGAEGNSIYAIGGGEASQPALAERFDLTTQDWSTIGDTSRPGPWHHAVGAMIGPNLHIVGGWGGDYLGSQEIYQASFWQFLPFGSQGAQG